jgi:hypothetical protein
MMPIHSSSDEFDSHWHDAVRDFKSTRYAPHGQSMVRYEQGLLFYEHTGPFNAEFFEGLGTLREKIRRWGGLPAIAGVVVTFRGNVLFTPEALEKYRSFLGGPTNVRLAAYVVPPDAEAREFALPLLRAIWTESNLEWRLFEEIEGATRWARARLSEIAAN